MGDRFRIILTVNYSPWSAYSGGGQRSTHSLAVELARRGHDVHVIYSKVPFEQISTPNDLPYALHWAWIPGIRSQRNMLLRPAGGISFRTIVKRLCREFRQRGAFLPENSISDEANFSRIQHNKITGGVIVHANGEEAGWLGGLKKRYGFRLISTPRYSSYPDAIISNGKTSILQKMDLALHDWKYLAQAKVLQISDLICPPSEWAGQKVSQIRGVRRERVSVVPNGVPDEFLSYRWTEPASSSGRDNSAPILFFGRLHRDKGVDLLIRAYALLQRPRPPLWIVGEGKDQGHFEKLAAQLNLGNEVRFLPWQPHNQLGELIAGSRLCVFPARHENFSLAILSALAVGVPTIGTRVGGTPEMIQEGDNGLLVEPENIDKLAEAIQKLLSDRRLANKLGDAARRWVRTRATWSIAAERFEEVYSKTLNLPDDS